MNNETLKLELIKDLLNIKDANLIKRLAILLNEDKINTATETLNEENSNYNTSLISTKLNIIKRIINLEDKATISKFEANLNKNDFWNELNDSHKEEIELADLEILNGKTVDYKSFIASHLK